MSKNILSMLKCGGFSVLISVILLLIASLVGTFIPLSEKMIIIVVNIISVLSIFLSGIIASVIYKSKGLLFGAVAGIIYSIFVYILGAIIYKNFGITLNTLIGFVISIVSGAFGGVTGVNLIKK
ncbi:MAG: TIGR04086 family membrane protein [Clostridia bacterium]|nr:TIGR04086 family membrane protein [Clostridia bacterium]